MTLKNAWRMLAETIAAHANEQAHYLCWYTNSEWYADVRTKSTFVQTVPLKVRAKMTKEIDKHLDGPCFSHVEIRGAEGRDVRVLFCLLMAEVNA